MARNFNLPFSNTDMRKILPILLLIPFALIAQNAFDDKDATALLKASSAKYKSFASIAADFTLTTISPKRNPTDADAKYTQIQKGKVHLKGNKFKLSLMGNDMICDGKNIWTIIAKSKECQLNEYEESKEIFSPTKIFNLYENGFAYQTKEKKELKGRKITIIEMTPTNKKVSFFKIDAGIDETTKEILEIKVYEKNGTRYIYTLDKVNTDISLTDSFFSFDSKLYPGIKIVDLR